ncbi:M13 family metallopeptidase [Lysobacter sp. A3-1-A15]|uniref:M13 family metallopeptidase n=1 Tax=Novilysobacter viscosus TaxID=3098602 RepID=UPI002ED92D94
MPRHALRPLALALALTLASTVAGPAAHAQSVEPPAACTDFHGHANASWLQNNPLPAGADSISALGQLTDRARHQQVELLNAAMQSPQGNVQQLLGDFWASGVDLASVERDGAQPIAPLLQRINAIRRHRDIAPAIAALHQVGIPVAFNFSADVDLRDLKRHIGYFSQGGLGLPDPAYYIRTDAPTRDLLGQYTSYVQKILALTGTPEKDVAAQAQMVVDLETRIANVTRPLAQLRDPLSNFAPVATADLDKAYPNLKLGEFLNTQSVSDDTVSVANPELFAHVDTLVRELKPEQWKAYLRWRVGDSMAPYMARAWRDASFDFRGRVLEGRTAPLPRQQMVLDAINHAAGPMLGREYANRYLPAESKSRAQEIATAVRNALGTALDRDTRLGPQAKAEAKAKLAAMKIEVGTPSRDLDYTIQPMGRGSFGGNMLIASTWHRAQEMRRIGADNADRRWNVLPQEPALAYDIAQNRLVVTAAILQAPVLDMTRDTASQFGSFGALVGHEISHGFDVRGRLVDAREQLRDWWTPADVSAWDTLGNRVITQYGALENPVIEGIRLNGAQSRDENIADLAGVELAWAAYTAARPDAPKEGREDFFEGWASIWAEHVSPAEATRRAASSVHAPGKWRTNAPLMNHAAFAETFGCKASDPMQLADGQRVVLWP